MTEAALPRSRPGVRRSPLLVRHLLGAPLIYGLVLPLAFLDAMASLYQAACFRLWDIPRVRRAAYVSFARAELPYLDAAQRLNCGCCSYANGVLAYAREIAARTELYWCPIKHAERPPGAHGRYEAFLAYGDGRDVAARIGELRRRARNSREGTG